MNIEEATARYERWLGRFMPLVRADIEEKHRRMTLGPFLFLRATFYRWCQLWRAAAGDAARASRVLAVGDLHVENFGTWRDADGRLEEVPWVGGIKLTILGRDMFTDALVAAAGTTPLIGQIPLEELDLLVDPKSRELRVNPSSPDAPLLDALKAA